MRQQAPATLYGWHNSCRSSAHPPRSHSFHSHTMVLTTTDGSTSIFKGGKLKSGIYKIQARRTSTFGITLNSYAVDPPHFSRMGKGWWVHVSFGSIVALNYCQWETRPSESGYTIRRVRYRSRSFHYGALKEVTQVRPGKPGQFCMMIDGLDGANISVAAFPVAWRVEVAREERYRGQE